MAHFAKCVNSMPKYVASRTLSGPLEWNATLLDGNVEQTVPALKEKHTGNLIVSGCGELAHTLIFDGVGPVRLQFVSSTQYRWVSCGCATGRQSAETYARRKGKSWANTDFGS
jgi:hypothetical protein